MRKLLGWLAVGIGLFLVGGGVYLHVQTGESVAALLVPGLMLLVLAAVALTGRRPVPRRW